MITHTSTFAAAAFTDSRRFRIRAVVEDFR